SLGSLPVTALPLPVNRCVVPGPLLAQCNGAFGDLSAIVFGSVTDGLSNTIFVAEKSTTILRELDEMTPSFSDRHGWYITGNWGDTLVTALYPPNAQKKVAMVATSAWTNSASSLHVGGVNVLMGDGSVRFIKDSVDSWQVVPTTGDPVGASRNSMGCWVDLPRAGVWQALSTRSGGEAVDSSAF
ncbi:MAG: DUF1559 domain-containing protein, partial [Isosphaeraceae bacterium]